MPRDDRLPAALLGALVPAGLAFANGGYFPREWGLAALLLLLVAATALLLRDRIVVDRLALAPAAAFALLGLWQLATLAWSPGPTEPVLEAERTLVYLALSLAAPLVVSRASAPWLAGGLVAGVVAVSGWALATRLWPGRLEPFDPGQLAEPIGYWNAQGILAVLGLLLALGLVALPSVAVRAAASAAMPVLAAALALTFSRGSWLAFAAGLGVLAVVASQRLRLAALAVPGLAAGALAAAAAGSLDGLTREDATLAAARDDGRRLAVVLLVLVAAAALGAVGAARLERRWTPGASARRAWTVALAGVGAAVVVAGLVRVGNPLEVVGRVHRAASRGERRPRRPARVGLGQRPRRLLAGGAGASSRTSRSAAAARAAGSGGGSSSARPPLPRATRTTSTSRRSPSSARSGCSSCSRRSSRRCSHSRAAGPPRPPAPRMPRSSSTPRSTGTGRSRP